MDDRPSAKLHDTVAARFVESVSKMEVQWEFVERLIQPVMTYLKECLALDTDWRGYYATAGRNELEVMVSIGDDDGDTLFDTVPIQVSDLVGAQYSDCYRSAADLIFALERSLEVSHAKFEKAHGFKLTRESLKAKVDADFPNRPSPAAEDDQWKPETEQERENIGETASKTGGKP